MSCCPHLCARPEASAGSSRGDRSRRCSTPEARTPLPARASPVFLPAVRDRVRSKMERDILAEVNHPFIVKLHYGECGGRRPDATGVLCGGPGAGTLQVSRRQAEPLPQPRPLPGPNLFVSPGGQGPIFGSETLRAAATH